MWLVWNETTDGKKLAVYSRMERTVLNYENVCGCHRNIIHVYVLTTISTINFRAKETIE